MRTSDGSQMPFTDVELADQHTRAFADAEGRFRLANPTWATAIRVRRVGFKPTVITIQPNDRDTIRVTLDELHLVLEKVAVSRAKYSIDGHSSEDTAVVALLEQAHLTAERAALFAER